MKFIAHKNESGVQTLLEHLSGTAERSGGFASKFGKREWGYCCGMLHDIGKYSLEFQQKIQKGTDEQVDHSTAGAQLCQKLNGYYSILSYCIAGHHAGLADYGNSAISSSLCGRLGKKVCNYDAYQKEIVIPIISTPPVEMKKEKNMDFSLSVFIRMLYSCLVDADYLDTEYFMKNGNTEREQGEAPEVLLEKLNTYTKPWLNNTEIDTVNGRRTEILKACQQNGKNNERGIFRLTVPTGGGKTIASLAFALNHAVKHGMDRIIYVIPYTSIIEQNAQIFRDILGNENVLENHCNVEYADTEELQSMQLASENWDKPVVVTTNVQFFESLFGNKSSKCRKLHNIASSVVILDEAQMLPLDYLKPCTSMLQELVDNYEVSVVLCSATQPALDQFFSFEKGIKELCPRVKEQFQFFERVTYDKLGTITKETLIDCLNEEERALCIVNRKKMAQEIYQELQGEGVYHLSTSMYPKHRKRILKKIRDCLSEHEKCIVVATSLVEAGVDLDFDRVYRETAGLDSIIQAAGRCNREGKKQKKDSRLYLFDLKDTKTILSQKQQIEVAKSVINDYEDMASLESVTNYFERLYHYRGTTLDKKNIMDEFFRMECNFAKVAKEFNLIEQDTKTIFIGKEPEEKELLQKIRYEGISKDRMRKAGQYCIQVYSDSRENGGLFEQLRDSGKIRLISEEMTDFYELVDFSQYKEEYGLELFIEDEAAIFM